VAESKRPELSKANVIARPDAELVHSVQLAADAGQAPVPAASVEADSWSPAWSASVVSAPKAENV
jgi:hypothetical protein